MSKFIFQLQDSDNLGDPIYRAGDDAKEAIKEAERDYPRVEFQVTDVYVNSSFCTIL